MNGPQDLSPEMRTLMSLACDDLLTEQEAARLESSCDAESHVRVLVDYLQLDAELSLLLQGDEALDQSLRMIGVASANATADQTSTPPARWGVPNFGFLSTTVPSTFAFFSSGWPVAYLLATVIFGIGLLIGSLVHVSEPVQVARQSVPLPSSLSSLPTMVGRITGMVDCRWAGTAFDSPAVPVGRKYELALGLMEITYDTGAKVILQGPVTYEVESKDGGFLSLGKLTARVEKRSETANQKSEIRNQKLFVVRTPTAIVTDLGTEFGVEVSKEGHTTSHVFRGVVRLQSLSADGGGKPVIQVLHENESARVERSRDAMGGGEQITVARLPAASASFVREIPIQTIKTLDLVDVVAGGDGFSGRRGRGIDPTTGRIGVQPDNPDTVNAQGDYKYHRVEGIPFVDGVFIPEGSKGPVQIDSAGHVFPDCPKTDNWSYAYVWAGGKLPPIIATRVSPILEGIDYSSSEHSLLFVHANKGITFNLDAIRRSNPGYEVMRLRAAAGNVETESQKGANVSADIWVLVDGQVRFKRREFNGYNGAATVAIPIHASDRFLTLAATDAGNTYMCDQIIFGDPRLELMGEKIPVHDTK